MKSFQAHTVAQTPHTTMHNLRTITAALLAGAMVLTTTGFAAKSGKLAAYASVKGAEKISIKLLELQANAKKTASVKAAMQPGDSRLLRTATGGKGETIVSLEIICYEVNDAVVAKISATGAKVTDSYPQYQRVMADVTSLDLLEKIAAIKEVAAVEPQYLPTKRSQGIADGRNDYAHFVQTAQQAGATGAGVTVGIMSDSFARSSDMRTTNGSTFPAPGLAGNLNGSPPQQSGDLPPDINILRDDIAGTDEGAAMGELIHDIAPDAKLAFHTAFQSEAGFAAGIARLADPDDGASHIIVDDVGFFKEPMYQDGFIAQAAAQAVKKGVAFFSAAGNSGDVGIISNYRDVNPVVDDPNDAGTPSGSDLHDWGNGNPFLPIFIPATSSGARIIMQWNQPFWSLNPVTKPNKKSGSQIDLDLYILDSADNSALENPVAESRNAQGMTGLPAGDPFEIIILAGGNQTVFLAVDHYIGNEDRIPQGAPLEFRIVVESLSGDPLEVEGFGIGGSLGEEDGGATIYGHGLAEGVVSVGAVPWWESPAYSPENFLFSIDNPFRTPTFGEIDPELFSSRGGDSARNGGMGEPKIQFTTKGKFK